MIDDAGPAAIARQLVGTLDLLLPCVPYLWDEEGPDDHGKLGQGPSVGPNQNAVSSC